MSDTPAGKPLSDKTTDSLAFIVQTEAVRSGNLLNIQPDLALIAEGWELRFTGDLRRIQEAAELYSEVGFEVLTVPVQPTHISDECSDCQVIAILQFQTIYTRRAR